MGASVLLAGLLTSVIVAGPAAEEAKPRLVVAIMIDQFPAEYLDRFGSRFGSDGFKRLQAEGAEFTNCHHGQAAAQTACGHAVLLTGRYPRSTGIVANYVWDRAANERRPVVYDADAPLLDAKGDGVSVRALLGPHLADQLKQQSPDAKVFSIAGKDRAAILMGGHRADGVYWWDKNTGRFITSRYYRKEYPAWVTRLNAARLADRYFGTEWTRALPQSAYAPLGPDDVAAEGLRTGFGNVFPHKLGVGDKPDSEFYTDVMATPFGNALVLEAAWAAVEAQGLGADETTDLLAIGLSATDYAGHSFGPDSHEIMDLAVRTDRQIADLLGRLDKRIGLERCLIVVSSDHGIAPLVEVAQQQGKTAGRVDEKLLTEKPEAALRERFGPAPSRYVAAWADPYLYLNYETLRLRDVSRETSERVAAEAIASIPGVQLACTRSDILSGQLPDGKVYAMVRRGFHPERSGDVHVVFEPYHTTYATGTMHHGPHDYDTHVPLLLMGPGIKPGHYDTRSAPGDVAPTLAQLLGVAPPAGNECRVLSEALE